MTETKKNQSKKTPTSPGNVRKTGEIFLNVHEASAFLKVNFDTMEKWRQKGIGPVFREHGRLIVYHIDDLYSWSESKKRQTARKYRTQKKQSPKKGVSK